MGEWIVLGSGLRVIADEDQRIEGLVELLDHGQGVAAPCPYQLCAIGQPAADDVAPRVMGILDHDLLRPGSDRAIAGRDNLLRHLSAELRICCVSLSRFIPMRYSRDSFDIGADVDLHRESSCVLWAAGRPV